MPALTFNNATSTHYQLPNNSANIKNSISHAWLGKSKSQILQDLKNKNLASISFASWLAMPSLGILIKFDHQICQNIDYY